MNSYKASHSLFQNNIDKHGSVLKHRLKLTKNFFIFYEATQLQNTIYIQAIHKIILTEWLRGFRFTFEIQSCYPFVSEG